MQSADERARLPRGGFLCKECETLDLRSALQRLDEEELAEFMRHQRSAQRVTVRRRA